MILCDSPLAKLQVRANLLTVVHSMLCSETPCSFWLHASLVRFKARQARLLGILSSSKPFTQTFGLTTHKDNDQHSSLGRVSTIPLQ